MPNKILKFFKIILFIFVVSFFINLFWEVAHSFLYDWNTFPLRADLVFYTLRILKSSIGDGFIMLGIYGLGLLKNRKVNWFSKPKISDYALVLLSGLFISVFIMLGIYGLGLLKNRKVNWFSKPKISDYALVLLSGLFISVFIEELNVNFLGSWAYNKLMPLIPGLNIGLTPILQMLILPLFIFKTISFFKMVDKWT